MVCFFPFVETRKPSLRKTNCPDFSLARCLDRHWASRPGASAQAQYTNLEERRHGSDPSVDELACSRSIGPCFHKPLSALKPAKRRRRRSIGLASGCASKRPTMLHVDEITSKREMGGVFFGDPVWLRKHIGQTQMSQYTMSVRSFYQPELVNLLGKNRYNDPVRA